MFSIENQSSTIPITAQWYAVTSTNRKSARKGGANKSKKQWTPASSYSVIAPHQTTNLQVPKDAFLTDRKSKTEWFIRMGAEMPSSSFSKSGGMGGASAWGEDCMWKKWMPNETGIIVRLDSGSHSSSLPSSNHRSGGSKSDQTIKHVGGGFYKENESATKKRSGGNCGRPHSLSAASYGGNMCECGCGPSSTCRCGGRCGGCNCLGGGSNANENVVYGGTYDERKQGGIVQQDPNVLPKQLSPFYQWILVWSDHITLTRLAIISILRRLPDTNVTVAALLANQGHIAYLLPDYVDKKAVEQLLVEHIKIAGDLVGSLLEKNPEKTGAIAKAWDVNGKQIADALFAAWQKGQSPIFPFPFLDAPDQERVRKMLLHHMMDHLENTKQEAISYYSEKYEDSLRWFHTALKQGRLMAYEFGLAFDIPASSFPFL